MEAGITPISGRRDGSRWRIRHRHGELVGDVLQHHLDLRRAHTRDDGARRRDVYVRVGVTTERMRNAGERRVHRADPRAADAIDDTAIGEGMQSVVEHAKAIPVFERDGDQGEGAQVEQFFGITADANEVVVGEEFVEARGLVEVA